MELYICKYINIGYTYNLTYMQYNVTYICEHVCKIYVSKYEQIYCHVCVNIHTCYMYCVRLTETYHSTYILLFFFFYQIFFFTHNITQHPKYNKTKQQTHTQHLKVQSKGRERGKDNKNTEVTPPYNHVYPSKNTAKHQWSKAWPHRLTPLYIHMTLFAGGYRSNVFPHVWCKPVLDYCLLHSCKTSKQHSLLHWTNTETWIIIKKTQTWVNRPINSQ